MAGVTRAAGHLPRLERQTASRTAGAAAGLVGLAVFLSLHAVWIVPIWSVAGLGAVVAVLGGAAAGWAYDELRAALPPGTAGRVAFVGLGAGVVLAPSLVLAYLLGPYVPVVDGVPVSPTPAAVPAIAARFVIELLVVTTAVGAGLGWTLARTRRAAVATATAAFAFAIGPGHNNPFLFTFGGTEPMLIGLGLTSAAVAASSVVLVVADRWLAPDP